jgi:hypothetical protein
MIPCIAQSRSNICQWMCSNPFSMQVVSVESCGGNRREREATCEKFSKKKLGSSVQAYC